MLAGGALLCHNSVSFSGVRRTALGRREGAETFSRIAMASPRDNEASAGAAATPPGKPAGAVDGLLSKQAAAADSQLGKQAGAASKQLSATAAKAGPTPGA